MAITLGIIGGGQLGMMLAEAAKNMPNEISEVVVLDPTPECPASQAGALQIVGGFNSQDAIKELAERADIITYEIESGDADVLESVGKLAQISPSPNTLRTLQDKYVQKQFLRKHGIPVGDFLSAETREDVISGAKKFGFPSLLKARRGAYDGRGNYLVEDESDIDKALEYFAGRPVYMERHIGFDLEVSIIAARNTHGQIKTYPLVENIHQEGVLRTTIAPARTNPRVVRMAEEVGVSVMESLAGAGVFGIEMFVVQGEVLVNEIAPRVHNSGHHTLQSSATSQFEQHLRAILGGELGDTALLHNAVMRNVLGPKSFSGPYTCKASGDGTHLKMYGKAESRPLRKLGHVNIILDGAKDLALQEAMSFEAVVKPA